MWILLNVVMVGLTWFLTGGCGMCDASSGEGAAAASSGDPTSGEPAGAAAAVPGNLRLGDPMTGERGDPTAEDPGLRAFNPIEPANRSSNPTAFSIASAFVRALGLLSGPAGTAGSLALNAEGNRSFSQSVANASTPAANDAGSNNPSTGPGSIGSGGPGDFMIPGMPEMTTTSPVAAFAPGGAVANATGTPTPGTGTPSSTQKANAAARFGGGISPDFLANLALLNTLNA